MAAFPRKLPRGAASTAHRRSRRRPRVPAETSSRLPGWRTASWPWPRSRGNVVSDPPARPSAFPGGVPAFPRSRGNVLPAPGGDARIEVGHWPMVHPARGGSDRLQLGPTGSNPGGPLRQRNPGSSPLREDDASPKRDVGPHRCGPRRKVEASSVSGAERARSGIRTRTPFRTMRFERIAYAISPSGPMWRTEPPRAGGARREPGAGAGAEVPSAVGEAIAASTDSTPGDTSPPGWVRGTLGGALSEGRLFGTVVEAE